MKKNILIVSYGYPPLNDAGAQRPYAFAKFLDKEKFQVYVLTCANPVSNLGVDFNFDFNIKGVKVFRVATFLGSNLNSDEVKYNSKNFSFLRILKLFLIKIGSLLIYPDKGLFWYPKVKKFINLEKEFIDSLDFVLSTSPGVTNHRIAKTIKKINNRVFWIADFRDFYYTNSALKGVYAVFHKQNEDNIVRHADLLIFVTKTMLDVYKSAYPLFRNKMNCIYNGFDSTELSLNLHRDDDEIVFFYAGTFYNGIRSPHTFFQILDKAIQNNLFLNRVVKVKIAGKIEEDLKIELQKYDSYKFLIDLGSLPRDEALKLMSQASFLWLIVGNLPSHYQTIPIKLFEYISSGRPILNFAPINSESSYLINEMNIGYNFDTSQFDLQNSYIKFSEIIEKYLNGDELSIPNQDSLDSVSWTSRVSSLENILLM